MKQLGVISAVDGQATDKTGIDVDVLLKFKHSAI